MVEASDVLDQMPFPLGVTRGPEHVVELLNPAAREILGARELLGHPIREALPEIAAQGLVELLDNTYRGGEPYGDPAQRVLLERDGRLVECWFSVGYAPLRQPDGTVSGLLLHAVETTQPARVIAEVHDPGMLGDALPGLRPPEPTGERGRGVFLARRLCDLVHLWTGPDGTRVRVESGR